MPAPPTSHEENVSRLRSSAMIEPGAPIGVLGGGQLGAMFANAARRLGYHVAVWDADPDAPGLKRADLPFTAPFTDSHTITQFARSVRVVTYEWENIPAGTCQALEELVPVRPGSRILSILQNRLSQKTFYAERGIPVTPFRPVRSAEDLVAGEEIGFPCICKTATAGYDGKGQWRLDSAEALAALQERLRQQGQPRESWILEQFVAFDKELSVLVVRDEEGCCRVYPVAENVHEAGILRTTRVPAGVEAQLAEQAERLAQSVVEALDGIGVFCIEMFLLPDGRLFVNEVAPRPHNSGHYTLDACTVSQFEQQVRAVCGLPLGEVRLLSPAAMVNLIGDDLVQVQSSQGIKELLSEAGAALHVYGKRSVRPGRKMGHVTFLAEKPEAAWQAASALRALQKRRE